MESNRVQRLTLASAIGMLLLYTGSQAAVILNPVLANLQAEFPNVPHSQIVLLSTAVSGAMIPCGFIAGSIAGKVIGYKKIAILSCLLILAGGCLPIFVHTSFPLVMGSRVLMGLGCGFIQPLGHALISLFYSGEKRSRMLGIGTAIMNAAGVILQFVAGIVCTLNTWGTFWLHLYIVIPLFLITIFMPEPKLTGEKEEKSAEEPAKKGGIPLIAVAFGLAYGLTMMFYYPLVLNSSFIMTSEEIGTAATAGMVASAYKLGGVAGSALVGVLSKKLGKFMIPSLSAVLLISYGIGAFSPNSVLYIAATFVSGMAFFGMIPATIIEFGKYVDKRRIGTATGVYTALTNVGAFLAAYYIGAVGSISGDQNPRLPLYAGVILVLAVSVLWTVYILIHSKKHRTIEA